MRILFILALSALCSAGWFLRLHLYELSQVATTYTTFYPYLASHPEVLYRYRIAGPDSLTDPSQGRNGSTSLLLGDDSIALVPRNLHQIHLQEGRASVLDKHSSAIQSCRALHPGWNHTIWTDTSANEFMRIRYPAIWPHYRGYKQSIQRANILRYALLEQLGGVYLDLDVTCLEPLDNLRFLPWLTPGAHPAGVNNAFILARPKHPFLRHLLDAVPSRDLRWGMPYIENMLSTGCMYFSNRWMSYSRALQRQRHRQNSEVTISHAADEVRILADDQGRLDVHMLRGIVTTLLFKHGGASSWHEWDAAMIVMVGKHYAWLSPVLGVMLVGGGWVGWRATRVLASKSRHRRRVSWSDKIMLVMSPTSPGREKPKQYDVDRGEV